ncbi:MAG: Bax inhibitor-1/YccA family protein [Geminicoccaceae bacterium]|nr:MAG: Bax inhibitor-1/YccA family protein [Geminicoccaceae bacterium]
MESLNRTMRAGVTTEALYDEGLRQHMLRVYNFMLMGLGLTGATALAVASSPAMMGLIFGTPLQWVVMLAPLGFVFFLSFRADKISAATAQTLFWTFCAVMGLSLASIFHVFTGASIARVFFITAAMFGAMSLFGYTTKRDLSNWGSFLIMGLFGVIIAMIVNIFLQSSMLQFVVSIVGVIVFTGLAAYDTQRIKEVYHEGHGTEGLTKLAVLGALSLYLSFINLFMMLLSLLGQRDD